MKTQQQRVIDKAIEQLTKMQVRYAQEGKGSSAVSSLYRDAAADVKAVIKTLEEG
jgi:hypothetical protein